MIRIENVSKRFGRTRAVDSVSLALPAGDSVALWGANGAVGRCFDVLKLWRERASDVRGRPRHGSG